MLRVEGGASITRWMPLYSRSRTLVTRSSGGSASSRARAVGKSAQPATLATAARENVSIDSRRGSGSTTITVGGLCNGGESGGVIGLLLRSCRRLLSGLVLWGLTAK